MFRAPRLERPCPNGSILWSQLGLAWPGNVQGILNLPGLAVRCYFPIFSQQILKRPKCKSATQGRERPRKREVEQYGICHRAIGHSDRLGPSATFCLCPDETAIWHCAAEHEGLLARGICNPYGTVPQLPIYGRNI